MYFRAKVGYSAASRKVIPVYRVFGFTAICHITSLSYEVIIFSTKYFTGCRINCDLNVILTLIVYCI